MLEIFLFGSKSFDIQVGQFFIEQRIEFALETLREIEVCVSVHGT